MKMACMVPKPTSPERGFCEKYMQYSLENEYDHQPTTLVLVTGSLKLIVKRMNDMVADGDSGDALTVKAWEDGDYHQWYTIDTWRYKKGDTLMETVGNIKSSKSWAKKS